jgi:peptidoglycan/LPS O-acetylase OafA/YrhL
MEPKNHPQADRAWAAEVIHGEYFPHIDGIRALAVIPVVLYHTLSWLCPGGYAGVDVFFVISGFLITGGIARGLRQGNFTIRSFYDRRVKRIIPAYFSLVVGVYLAGLVLLPHEPLRVLGETTLSSVLFSTNLYFWKTTGYFAPNAHENPLLNLWSLSVEEQFYIFLPVCLMLLWRWRREWVGWALSLAAILSLGLAVWLMRAGLDKSCFFLLPPRGWELLAGSLLALAPSEPRAGRANPVLGLAGLVLILIPYLAYTRVTPFPGLAAVPSVLGTSLLIRYGMFGVCGKILGCAPFVGVGRISYSLYLWHWPIIVFWTYVVYGRTGWLDYAGMIALSLVCAWFSWRWVELPVRRSRRWRPAWSAMLTAGCCLVMGIAGYGAIRTDGFRNWLHPAANRIASESYWQGRRAAEIPAPEVADGGRPVLVSLGDGTLSPSFLLWGDSHAMALAPGFDHLARQLGLPGVYLDRNHSLLSGVNWNYYADGFLEARAAGDMEAVFEWLSRTPRIRTVVLAGRWALSAEGTSSCALEPFPRFICSLASDNRGRPGIARNAALFESGLRETCRRLRAMGKKVLIVDSVPEHRFSVPEFARRSRIVPTSLSNDLTTEDYNARQARVRDVLGRLEASGEASVIRIQDYFLRDGRYVGLEGETVYYKDDDHLSPTGARFAASRMAADPRIRNLFERTGEAAGSL